MSLLQDLSITTKYAGQEKYRAEPSERLKDYETSIQFCCEDPCLGGGGGGGPVGNTCQGNTGTGTWGLVHLSIYKSALGLADLVAKLVDSLQSRPQ